MKSLCSKCNEFKDISSFFKNKNNKANNGLDYECKKCKSIYSKDYYIRMKEKNLHNKFYIKGVGAIREKEYRILKIEKIRKQFSDWCKNGGKFI